MEAPDSWLQGGHQLGRWPRPLWLPYQLEPAGLVQLVDCATPEFLFLGLGPFVPPAKVRSNISSVAVTTAQLNKGKSFFQSLMRLLSVYSSVWDTEE